MNTMSKYFFIVVLFFWAASQAYGASQPYGPNENLLANHATVVDVPLFDRVPLQQREKLKNRDCTSYPCSASEIPSPESCQECLFRSQKSRIESLLDSSDCEDIDEGINYLVDEMVKPSMCDETLDFIESLVLSGKPACIIAGYLAIIKIKGNLDFISSLFWSGNEDKINIAFSVLENISQDPKHPLQACALDELKRSDKKISGLYEAYKFNTEGTRPAILLELKQRAIDPLVQAYLSVCLQKDTIEAEAYWKECCDWIYSEARNDNPYAHYCLGLKVGQAGKVYEAMQQFCNAFHNGYRTAALDLAQLYLDHEYEWAYSDYGQPLELLDGAVETIENRSVYIRELREKLLAAKEKAKARHIAEAQTNGEGQFYLGEILRNDGKYEEALGWFLRAKISGVVEAEDAIAQIEEVLGED